MKSRLLPNESRAEKGAGSLTLVVFGALVIAVVYSASKILPFFYYYYDLQNQMATLISVAQDNSDKEIRKKLLRFMEKAGIPAGDKDLLIKRKENNTMTISLPYKEVFYITFRGRDYIIYTFYFHAHAEGRF